MKAKKVHETMNFQQNQDPYKALDIGVNRKFKIGDIIKITKFIYAKEQSGLVIRNDRSTDVEDSCIAMPGRKFKLKTTAYTNDYFDCMDEKPHVTCIERIDPDWIKDHPEVYEKIN